MTLYEIWYRSDWTDDVTNERQVVFTSVEKADQWLRDHLDDWYKGDDEPIENLVEQAVDDVFKHMVVTKLIVDDKGDVTVDGLYQKGKLMTLYEVWYHDAWRTRATYGRQTIQSSVEDLIEWLLSHKAEWYDKIGRAHV